MTDDRWRSERLYICKELSSIYDRRKTMLHRRADVYWRKHQSTSWLLTSSIDVNKAAGVGTKQAWNGKRERKEQKGSFREVRVSWIALSVEGRRSCIFRSIPRAAVIFDGRQLRRHRRRQRQQWHEGAKRLRVGEWHPNTSKASAHNERRCREWDRSSFPVFPIRETKTPWRWRHRSPLPWPLGSVYCSAFIARPVFLNH